MPPLRDLNRGLAAWVATQVEGLKDAEPEMPVEDRAADAWEPLIAIADLAGGHWPETAREACRAMCRTAEEDEGDQLGIKLLADIEEISLNSTTRSWGLRTSSTGYERSKTLRGAILN